MPFRFVLTNYNFTKEDIIEFNRLNNEVSESWTREEVQIVVLAFLLLIIIFTFIAIAGMDCFIRRCTKHLGPLISFEGAKGPSFSHPPPPSYSLPPSYTRSAPHIDHGPPQYNTTHITHLTIT
ncbi:hypothetical protein V3C99_014673 [Haemonchus contortus]|uniref:Uncharacterized protein n=1 Tax=Haemonchus contortus TaxID=6289 RepID=A0A7I4YTZ0_HAECO|nr:unnamed protein product [Haemonchus contortus]